VLVVRRQHLKQPRVAADAPIHPGSIHPTTQITRGGGPGSIHPTTQITRGGGPGSAEKHR